jgi:hypothetical protein
MKVEMKQYLRPNGAVRVISSFLSDEFADSIHSMGECGCWLEAEVLTTGEVRVTVTNNEADLDFSITRNGPDVRDGIEQMLKRKRWLDWEAEDEGH